MNELNALIEQLIPQSNGNVLDGLFGIAFFVLIVILIVRYTKKA
jgi:hypothetical protein